MKAFIVIAFIFCLMTIAESLTCYGSVNYAAFECPTSVKFCVRTSYVIQQESIPFYYSCSYSNNDVLGCVESGHSARNWNGIETDVYCCDTDLCNADKTFPLMPPQPRVDENVTEARITFVNITSVVSKKDCENVSTKLSVIHSLILAMFVSYLL